MTVNEAKEITLTPDEAKELVLCYRVWSNSMMEEIALTGALDPVTAKNMRRTAQVGKELERLLYEQEIL